MTQQALDLKWLQWAAHRMQYRLGWPGMAAIVLMLSTLYMIAGWIFPLQTEMAEIRRDLQAQQAALRLNPQPQRQEAASPEQALAQELREFDTRFPAIEKLPDELGVLFRLAEGHGLQVVKGEYSLAEKKQGNVRRFEASVPVQGNYQAVKALVLDVLDALPNVALAELSFERGEAVDAEAKTRLRLVFFIRKQAA
ncbi:hypothetical protein LG198_07805 [Methylobacillus arboreus]|uniref:hypothetical protein n=1 Tax=Methylobacillus arboreus TaxID=755170 RepID=UPI001E2FC076|nr:hypothetical protein [Methylobacillus arboreus]MCB5190626.1 hypothetical protein [Methylobacillus arboreus]